jgi:hypothetical protein
MNNNSIINRICGERGIDTSAAKENRGKYTKCTDGIKKIINREKV